MLPNKSRRPVAAPDLRVHLCRGRRHLSAPELDEYRGRLATHLDQFEPQFAGTHALEGCFPQVAPQSFEQGVSKARQD